MIGTSLDKYEVLQKVGEGGMATVYRGRHSTLKRDVAIKVLHPHLSSSPRNRKRFAREARAIEHLRHPNILEIFDYSGLDASECYIITEFVKGDTLSDLIRARGHLPSEVVTILGLDLSKALSYAHRGGILHRDLKPDNVMLRVDGVVKLMDFGIARFLDESQVTMTGALVGSPAFMSPEQAKEMPLDQRSDLFALGTLMFFLATGTLPFSGSNASLILKNVIESNRPSVAELAPKMSAALADVIERLMATNPDERFNTASEVEEALLPVLAESNVDPDDNRWCLWAFIEDPDLYEVRLEEHLSQVLLFRGKERLAAGDHLSALRLFNRLLAMDEDNEEILALVQGLHVEPARSVGSRPLMALVAVLFVLGSVGYAWVVSERSHEQAATPKETPLATNPLPVQAAPAPASVIEPAEQPIIAGEPAIPVAPPSLTPRPRPPPRNPSPVFTVSPPQPETSPKDDPGSLVLRNTNELIGRIRIDGKDVGNTRNTSPFALPPGVHQVEVHSPRIITKAFEVTVHPGEELFKQLDLQPRPAQVVFDANDYGASCVVWVNEMTVGALGDIGYETEILRPNEKHQVEVRCEGLPAKLHSYDTLVGKENFPAP